MKYFARNFELRNYTELKKKYTKRNHEIFYTEFLF